MPAALGMPWSSRWIPATPAFTCSATVRMVLSAEPSPSSASATTGIPTALAMRDAWRVISVIVRKPLSGQPFSMATE